MDEERLESFMMRVPIIQKQICRTNLQNKSMDWFLYDKNLHHEIVFIRGVATGGVIVLPTSIPAPSKVQKFHFHTSETLLFTNVQKLFGPENS